MRPRPPSHAAPTITEVRVLHGLRHFPPRPTSALNRFVPRHLRVSGSSMAVWQQPKGVLPHHVLCGARSIAPYSQALRSRSQHPSGYLGHLIPIQPSRGQHGHARSHSHRGPNEAPGTSCSSGSTKTPPFHQRQPIQVTQVQAQGGFGLTRRCSGLTSFAAELHFVRPQRGWARRVPRDLGSDPANPVHRS